MRNYTLNADKLLFENVEGMFGQDPLELIKI